MRKGDKVYITTLTKVYEGEIISKDKSSNHLNNGEYYIVKIPKTDELVSVAEDMLTHNKELLGGKE